MGAPIGLRFELTEGEIQAQTRGAVQDSAEPDGGHAGGGLHERQRDRVERDEPRSGEK